MCWLRVYAWLRVKIKAKSTGVRSVWSWSLDDRTREFPMCWQRPGAGYAWLRVKIKSKSAGVRSVLSWSLDGRNEAISYVLATRLRDRAEKRLRMRHWRPSRPISFEIAQSARHLARKYRLEQHIPNERASSLLTSQ